MQFLFVGSNVCRLLPSDSWSPTTPLLLAKAPYCKAPSGLAPYSSYTCLAHKTKAFFDESVAGLSKNPTVANYRARQSRSILWEKAIVGHLATSDAIIAPVIFKSKLFVASQSTPSLAYNLSDITFLIISQDVNRQLRAYTITHVPENDNINDSSSGYYFIEDWQGNSLYPPIHRSSNSGQLPPKQAESIQTIQVCNEIDGYNYSPENPEDGYFWSETTCTTYGYSKSDGGSGSSGGAVPGFGITYRRPSIIAIPAPNSPIADITDYLKCFTNGSSPDHTYSVQVCVDQPDPGTREAWGFSSGGPIGSSSAGNIANAGHSFLVLSENDQGNIITRNVGFYPSTIVVPTTAGEFSQGILNNDQSHQYNINLTVSISSNQFFNILSYVSLGNNQGYDYNLSTNNCTTFVINAMAAGNVTLPSTKGSWPGGSGNDPGDMGEDIRNMLLSSNMTRNTVDNDHPNVGNCN